MLFIVRSDVEGESYIDDCFFYSKAFGINYCEQTIDLDDICIFRIYYKSNPKVAPVIKLRIALLYCE